MLQKFNSHQRGDDARFTILTSLRNALALGGGAEIRKRVAPPMTSAPVLRSTGSAAMDGTVRRMVLQYAVRADKLRTKTDKLRTAFASWIRDEARVNACVGRIKYTRKRDNPTY